MDLTKSDNLNDLSNYSNSELKAQAKMLLNGQWNKYALLSLIFLALSGSVSGVPGIGGLASLVITGPLSLGLASIFLKLINQKEFKYEDIFSGFYDFQRSFLAHLLILVFTILWALLFIIPGIIAILSYSLTYYIMSEDPDITANEARLKSKELMVGFKGELFMLGLSFIGWGILCIFTLGIGILWLIPYVNTSFALFYKKVISSKS